jgi:hypothetical protein
MGAVERQGAGRPAWSGPCAAALAALVASAAPAAFAQSASPARPPAKEKPAKPPAETEKTLSELVVTADKPQPGAVVGDIKPELQMSPAEIQSYGVSTVTELLDELAPQIRSDRGRGGEAPVVLLNGRRVSGFNEIRDIPTEAILRVDILPEEVALKYGFPANQRVVNIVLRPFFRAWTAEGTAGAPTEGGQVTGQAELDLMRIRRDRRLNLDLKVNGSTALTEDERDVVSTTPGEGQFRTLVGASKAVSANAVYTEPIGGGVQATVNGTLGATHSEALNGLPSPGVTAFGPLRQTVDGWTAHLGTTLNRDLAKWRFNLTGAYDHADSLTHSDTGLSAADVPAPLLTALPQDKGRSLSDGLAVHFLASGPSLDLPAGQLYTSFRVGDVASWFASNSFRAGLTQGLDFSRNDASAHANIDVPIASRSHGFLGFVGELSVNGNLAVDQLSDAGTLTTIGYGLNWRPITGLSVILSHTRDEAAPSFQQLGGPIVVTPGVRLFDFGTGKTVVVNQVSGGNPALTGDARNVTKLGLTWKPISDQDLTLTANYIRSVIRNPIETFPAVTAAIEAVFPDRFTRDRETGELTRVDYRPVNFAAETRSDLRLGFNYSRPLGPQPPPRPQRRFGPQRRPDGASPPDGAPPPDGGPEAGPPPPGGFGGRGGGGFRGGGPGGRGGAAPGRLQFAAYYTIYFEDQYLVRPGGPVFDLLNGSPMGSGGGQPRQQVELQAGALLHGLGARISANWNSATVVHGAPGTPTGDLHFSDIAKLDLRLFADLGQQQHLAAKYPWVRGMRVTFSVTNLFDTRQRVTDATGATPLLYQPDLLDPVGRVAKISLRKLFF